MSVTTPGPGVPTTLVAAIERPPAHGARGSEKPIHVVLQRDGETCCVVGEFNDTHRSWDIATQLVRELNTVLDAVRARVMDEAGQRFTPAPNAAPNGERHHAYQQARAAGASVEDAAQASFDATRTDRS
jgi:hypothetical protein